MGVDGSLLSVRVEVRSTLGNSYPVGTYDLAVYFTAPPEATFTYTYDGLGNVLTDADSEGGLTEHHYNEAGQEIQTKQSGADVTYKRVAFTYDLAGRTTGTIRYSSSSDEDVVAQTAYTYDDVGNLRTRVDRDGSDQTLARYDWTYDAANRLDGREEWDPVGGMPSEYTPYEYDETDHLTQVGEDPSPDEAYEYDAAGNRTGGGQYQTTHNRLTQDATYTYAYDDEGDLTSRTTGAVEEYTWDYRNRLTSVADRPALNQAATRVITYEYDAMDRRTAMSLDPDGDGTSADVQRTTYEWDGDQVVLTAFNPDTQDLHGSYLDHRYLYGPGVDQVLADEVYEGGEPDALLWTLADQEGSVRTILDEDGTAVNRRTYDSFGKMVSQSDPDYSVGFGFTGQSWDSLAGLYYYRARWYDPQTGRFLSEDPAGADANLYRYVGNNPTTLTDPSGMCSWWAGVGMAMPQNSPGDFSRFGPLTSQSSPAIATADSSTIIPGGGLAFTTSGNGRWGDASLALPGNHSLPGSPAPAGPSVPTWSFNKFLGQLNTFAWQWQWLPQDYVSSGTDFIAAGAVGCAQGVCNVARGVKNTAVEIAYQAADTANCVSYLVAGKDLYKGDLSALYAAAKSSRFNYDQYVAELLANVGTIGVYAEVKATYQYTTGQITVDQYSEQMGATGVFQLATAGVMKLSTPRGPASYELTDFLNELPSSKGTGNRVHYDQMNGGVREQLPMAVRNQYPDTQLYFRPRGKAGPDVEVLGGTHPSDYPGSEWLPGNNFGDFKPGNASGMRRFVGEIQGAKLPRNTQFLPYSTRTGAPIWNGPSGGRFSPTIPVWVTAVPLWASSLGYGGLSDANR